jgi:hypothetical protein
MLPAIVFRMAFSAFSRGLRAASSNDARMVTPPVGEPDPDFLMTIEAFELGRTRANDMASAALK